MYNRPFFGMGGESLSSSVPPFSAMGGGGRMVGGSCGISVAVGGILISS